MDFTRPPIRACRLWSPHRPAAARRLTIRPTVTYKTCRRIRGVLRISIRATEIPTNSSRSAPTGSKAATTSSAISSEIVMSSWRRWPATGVARKSLKAWGAGFTLIELMVVILIMGLMFTFVMPQIQGFRQAALKSQARRLAGRASYLYDEATGHKLVLRLIFDMDNNGYATAQLDPYAVKPVFAPDNTHADG